MFPDMRCLQGLYFKFSLPFKGRKSRCSQRRDQSRKFTKQYRCSHHRRWGSCSLQNKIRNTLQSKSSNRLTEVAVVCDTRVGVGRCGIVRSGAAVERIAYIPINALNWNICIGWKRTRVGAAHDFSRSALVLQRSWAFGIEIDATFAKKHF